MIEALRAAITVLVNALPEAIGGGVVALILLGVEGRRRHLEREERLGRGKFAAITELRAIREASSSVANDAAIQYFVKPLRAGVLGPLVQVAMEGIGKPDLEAPLAATLAEIETFNVLANSLLLESAGSARAMGDHDRICDQLRNELRLSASRVVVIVSQFIEHLER